MRKQTNLEMSFWSGVAMVALCVGQVGCHACGGACNDYASPVADAACGHCNSARAGSIGAGSIGAGSIGAPTYEGETIVMPAPTNVVN